MRLLFGEDMRVPAPAMQAARVRSSRLSRHHVMTGEGRGHPARQANPHVEAAQAWVMPRAQQPSRLHEKALREAEARVAASLDQLLRDHAEWARLKHAAAEAQPPVEVPAPRKPARAPRPKQAKNGAAVAAPAAPPTAPKREGGAKRAVARPAAASPAPAPAAPATAARKEPRRRTAKTPHERARMRALEEARRKLEAMGVKPWKPKKTPGGPAAAAVPGKARGPLPLAAAERKPSSRPPRLAKRPDVAPPPAEEGPGRATARR